MAQQPNYFASLIPQFGGLAVVAALAVAILGGEGKRPAASNAAASKEEKEPDEVKNSDEALTTHRDKLEVFGILARSDDKKKELTDLKLAANSSADFLIVAVPDPNESQLALRFDQTIDAVTRAMGDMSCTLDRFWFPWQRQSKKNLTDEEERRRRASLGIMIFRRNEDSARRLVVLLVGEGPLRGMNRRAFHDALNIASLGTDPVSVVAPNFTGSADSLRDGISNWQGDDKNKDRKINLVNGSALQLSMPKDNRLNYRTTRVPLDILEKAILHYLKRPGRTDPKDLLSTTSGPPPESIAYLVESNSGFGAAGAANRTSWVLRFPMHLSRLSGILTQAEREREEKLGFAQTGSQLKQLDEKRKGEDLLPSFDEQRAALVNQRLLQDYWETLRRERVRYVGIVATDVRDRIFLIGQLHKECPNAIVFVYGADHQLAHPDYLAATRGTLVVGCYSLNPQLQQWSKQRAADSRRVPFVTEPAQGIYNAVLLASDRSDLLLDYAPPAWAPAESTRPPVWITAVGDDGTMLPLAIFTDYDSPAVAPAAARSARAPAAIPQSAPLRHIVAVLLLAAVVGVYAVRKAFKDREPGAATPLAMSLKLLYTSLMAAGILFVSLPVGLYLIAVSEQAGSSRFLWSGLYSFDGIWFIVAVAAAFAIPVCAGIFWRKMKADTSTKSPAKSDFTSLRYPKGAVRLPWIAILLGLLVVIGVFLHIVIDTLAIRTTSSRILFAERSALFGAGASAVLAGCWIAAGLFLYGLVSLSLLERQTGFLVACPYPEMSNPKDHPQKVLYAVLNKVREQAGKTHRVAASVWEMIRARTWAAIAVAVAVIWLVTPAFVRVHPTWEGRAWDCAFLTGVICLIVLSAVSTLRLIVVWGEIERLLRYISRVPMVGAFDHLPDKVYRTFSKYLLSSRRRGEDILIPHTILVRMSEAAKNESPTPADPLAKRPDFAPMPEELSGAAASKFSSIAESLIEQLIPKWIGRDVSEAYGNRVDPESKDAKPDSKTDSKYDELAEQFIAIQAVIFLSQYFHQLRYMAFLAAIPAGALLLTVTSYPFMPESLIMYTASAIVGTVLASIVWVIYRVNKNGIVSRVARSRPGFTFDLGLIQNFAALVLPLLLIAVVKVSGRWRTVAEPVMDLIR